MIYRGKLLDGRHRRRAAVKLNINLPVHDLPPDCDPAEYVEAANLHRRSLTAEQRGQCIVKLYQWRTDGVGPKKPAHHEPVSEPEKPAHHDACFRSCTDQRRTGGRRRVCRRCTIKRAKQHGA